MMDDDALQKYTDCVYFLASALTCKKGSECEFRHSEVARINPRDCRYWLSTGCINKECPFRHPPLDGSAVTRSIPLTSKVQVPCFYYYQGYCVKGDFCSFMHGAPSVPNLAVSAPEIFFKTTDPKTDAKLETANALTGMVAKAASKSQETVVSETISSLMVNPQHVTGTTPDLLQVPSSSRSDSGGNGRALEGALIPAPASGKWCVHPSQPSDDRLQSGEEAEENWKESSPGFDVLVDNGPDQLTYYADGHFLSEQDVALDSAQNLPLPHGARGGHSIEDFKHFNYLSGYVQPYSSTGHFDNGMYDVYGEQFDYQQFDPYDEMLDPRAIYTEGLPDDYIHNQVEYLVDGENVETAVVDDFDGFHLKRQRVEEHDFSHEHNSRRRPVGILLEKFHQREWQDSDRQHIFSKQSGRANHHRVHDRSVEGTERIRKRSFHNAASECLGHIDRFGTKIYYKGRSVRDRGRLGPRKHDHTRMLNSSASSFNSESIVFKTPVEPQNPEETRHISDFAGPKTLAELKAKKGTGKYCEGDLTSVTNKSAEKSEKIGSSMTVLLKSDRQMSSIYLSEPEGMKHEKKIILGKLVCESKTVTSFEGPKPLSALLEAKREVEKVDKAQLNSFSKNAIEFRMVNKATQKNVAKLSTSTADSLKDLAKKDEGSRNETKGVEVNKRDIHELDLHPVYGKINRMERSFEEDNWKDSKKYQGIHSIAAFEEMTATVQSVSNEGLENEEDAVAEYDEDDEFTKTLGGLFS